MGGKILYEWSSYIKKRKIPLFSFFFIIIRHESNESTDEINKAINNITEK